jgi:hypothetical protein
MLGVTRPAMTALPVGTIEGVVKNDQGQPLPRVQLTLRATTGRIVKTATSRSDGRYRFASIPEGDYTISGVKRGFATAIGAVAVRAGEHVAADLILAGAAPSAAKTAPPNSGTPPPIKLEEVNIVAKRLEAARVASGDLLRISPSTTAAGSTPSINSSWATRSGRRKTWCS